MDQLVESYIDGVVVQPLKTIEDERGSVKHMLRCDSKLFQSFGEIYFSTIKSGVVKAWKRHGQLTQHLAVPVGGIRLVIYDPRENALTANQVDIIETGADHYQLICIPPGVWYCFKGLSPGESLIANCTNEPYDPSGVERLPFDSNIIPYVWAT